MLASTPSPSALQVDCVDVNSTPCDKPHTLAFSFCPPHPDIPRITTPLALKQSWRPATAKKPTPNRKSRTQHKKSQALHGKQRETPTPRSKAPTSTSNILAKPDHKRSTRAAERYKKTCLPFLKLPAEIRNQIYGYLLISKDPIGISALGTDEYERARSRQLVKRTTFIDNSRHGGLDAPGRSWTTYAFVPVTNEAAPFTSLLGLNWQTRMEASAIFYGANSFVLVDSRCVMPFMSDMSIAIQGMIRNFKIEMNWGYTETPGVPGELPHLGTICGEWGDVLPDLGRCPGLRLKEINFRIRGRPDRMWWTWIRKRYGAGICNLEHLNLEISTSSVEEGLECYRKG